MTNRHWKKRTLCLLLVAFSLFLLIVPVSAEDADPMPSMEEAASVYFYHIESDRVIGTKDESSRIGAGASVKIMSGLLFCEIFENRMNENVLVTSQMLSGLWGHRMGLQSGDEITVKELLYGAVCASYNDAFYVLAHTASGSLFAFVEQMNARARAMGLENTYFTDPAGLDNGSVTTAEDIARLSMKAYENRMYMQLCGTENRAYAPKYAHRPRGYSRR